MSFPETVQAAKNARDTHPRPKSATIVVENVAYQGALWQELKRQGYDAKPFEIHGQDKRTRLALLSEAIKSGDILFPRTGASELVNQIVNFGVEKHDDLADAFVACASYAKEKKVTTYGVWVINTEPERRYTIHDVFPNW